MSKKNTQNKKTQVVVKKGEEETTVLRWDDLLEMNREVKNTLKEIIDEIEKFKESLDEETLKQDVIVNMLKGIEKEIKDRYEEIILVEKLHSKEEEIEENGKKIKRRVYFVGEVVQDPDDPRYDPRLFEVYLIALNQYANILVKLQSIFNIGKLTVLANANLTKGEKDGTTE